MNLDVDSRCPGASPQRGRLVLVVGPSGAGKDTILRRIEMTVPIEAGIVVCRRYITRPADPFGEHHIPLSPRTYEALAERGSFVLGWKSHGLAYGIGREVLSWLDAGMIVVVNGSRAHVEDARAKFADRLRLVLVTASPRTLAARLAARNRETRAQIAERLSRTIELPADVPDLTIHNDDDLSSAVNALCDFLMTEAARCG